MPTHEAKIPYEPEALSELGASPAEIEAQMRIFLAATLFQKGTLSIGKAAAIAGLSKVRFMFKLGELGIPVINLSGDKAERDWHLADDLVVIPVKIRERRGARAAKRSARVLSGNVARCP